MGRVAAASVWVAALIAIGSSPVGAQADPVEPPEPPVERLLQVEGDPSPDPGVAGTLRLISQTASVESDGSVDVTIAWDGTDAEDLFLSVLFHQQITSEFEVGDPSRTILNRRDPIPLRELPADPDGNLVVSVPVRSVSSGDGDRLYLPGPGVYPFTIQVRSSEGLVSSVSSTVVRLPQDRSELATIDFAVILALSPADGLDLSDGMWFLTTYPEVPFTIQVDEAVLTQLESDPALGQQFAAASAGRPVLSNAGIDLDPAALAEINQARFFTEALEANRRRLERLGLRPLPEVVMLSSDLTAQAVDLLASSGVQAVLSTRTNEIETGAVRSSSNQVQVIQADRPLTSELSSSASFQQFSPVDIYSLYSRLSLRARDDRASVILGGEGVASLDSLSVDAFLATLTEAGPLRPVSLLGALDGQPRNVLAPAERPEQDLLDSGPAIAELQSLAQTSRTFRGVDNPNLDQLLLDSLSRTRNPTDRARAIERAREELVSDLSSISLPETQSLTLAAVEGPLPLTIRNEANGSRRVRLDFRGDRVSVAEDGQTITVAPGESTVELSATAQALGVSTLEVILSTPDGARVLSSSRYQIRSTAVPGLGWAISGTALLFLALWWFRNWKRTKPQHPHLVGGNPPKPMPETRPSSPALAAETLEAM